MSSVKLNSGMNIANLQVIRCLGSGSYGDVYLCRNPDGDEFAVKIEEIMKRQLDVEISVYEKLAEVLPTNFCSFFSSGHTEVCSSDGRHLLIKYLVISVVGRSLAKLLLDCNSQFSSGTAIGVSIQLLDAIYVLHDLGFVHCDIKMENMAIGQSDSERRRLYLFDFGHAHNAVAYSRKIDIEPWFYITIRMFYGQIGQRSLDEILPQCPSELHEIYSHIKELKLHQRPDYDRIKRILRTAKGRFEQQQQHRKACPRRWWPCLMSAGTHVAFALVAHSYHVANQQQRKACPRRWWTCLISAGTHVAFALVAHSHHVAAVTSRDYVPS
uniref:Protein kinase domain-containing protein n=1 Tax=Globodera rostochiensis TaxID=31243 RepID=A0A914IEP5_GLORO